MSVVMDSVLDLNVNSLDNLHIFYSGMTRRTLPFLHVQSLC